MPWSRRYWSRPGSELGNPEPAPLERPVAQSAPLALAQGVYRGPADVPAARTLGIGLPQRSGACLPVTTAAEALDDERLHLDNCGPRGGGAPPPFGEWGDAPELGRFGRDALRCLEQLVPRPQLHSRTTQLLARGPLELVDRRPARIEDRANASLREQRLRRLGAGLLLVPMIPVGPRLIQPAQ